MTLEMTEKETDLLLELIESSEEAAIRSMNHADSRAFKHVLRKRLQVLASLKAKIRAPVAKAA